MKILLENLPLVISTIGTAIAGIWAYVINIKNRKLKNALVQNQVEDNALDVTAKNMRLYQDMMDDIKKRFEATIEEYRHDVERLKILLEESRETIGRQEVFLKEKNAELDRLRVILTKNKINFKRDEK